MNIFDFIFLGFTIIIILILIAFYASIDIKERKWNKKFKESLHDEEFTNFIKELNIIYEIKYECEKHMDEDEKMIDKLLIQNKYLTDTTTNDIDINILKEKYTQLKKSHEYITEKIKEYNLSEKNMIMHNNFYKNAPNYDGYKVNEILKWKKVNE